MTQSYENIINPPVQVRPSAQKTGNTQKEENLNTVVELQEELISQSDAKRQVLVATIGHQSKQTQAEIYLSVALDKDIELSNQNQEMLKSLKHTQEQNNTIKAYAAYQDNQGQPELRFS